MTAAVGTIEYMAPELLEHIHFPNSENGVPEIKTGHKSNTSLYGYEVDVYAFSIILWEIATRRYPYLSVRRTLDIQQMVLAGLRLRLPAGCRLPVRYTQLMNRCWQESPRKRPSFVEVAQLLQDIWFNDCEALDEEDGTAVKPSEGGGGFVNGNFDDVNRGSEYSISTNRSLQRAEDLIRSSWSDDTLADSLLRKDYSDGKGVAAAE
mmetsp:Transcript_15576/g.21846  ORF Transcript_15576/g.21846 Transcript_15576/m.21846 type:complete len:207 (+) Transcript_15576:545-1165(+)